MWVSVFLTGFLVCMSRAYSNTNAGLTSIPSGISSTETEIYLSNNQLTTILSGAFSSFTSLSICDLSTNQITFVHPDAFAKTPLVKLKLNFNQLTSLPDVSVVGPTLNILEVYNNRITDISTCQWSKLTELRQLHLQYNTNLTSILPLKNNCPSLAYFTLEGTAVTDLQGVVDTCPKMIYFLWKKIAGAGNVDIQDMFASTQICNIDLQYRDMTEFPNLPYVGLLNLVEIQVSGNSEITDIPLEHLKGSKLQTLRMDRTGFKVIPDLSPLKDSLKSLYMRYCSLTSMSDYSPFMGFTVMETLSLTGSRSKSFPKLSDAGKTLTRLELDINELTGIMDADMVQMDAIEVLNMKDNEISGDWKSLRYIAPTIKELYLSGDYMMCFDSTVLPLMTQLVKLDLTGQWLDCMADVSYPYCLKFSPLSVC